MGGEPSGQKGGTWLCILAGGDPTEAILSPGHKQTYGSLNVSSKEFRDA